MSACDRGMFEFENGVIDQLGKSSDHTIEAIAYKVHCTTCHPESIST